ncbi:MAG: hypothetical protein KatS3mg110_2442 [Pirellulaceae bacterium]|nr:MAG: hypothetical protein KatS3mg110_2442 [Pirellulaceae bacterium]
MPTGTSILTRPYFMVTCRAVGENFWLNQAGHRRPRSNRSNMFRGKLLGIAAAILVLWGVALESRAEQWTFELQLGEQRLVGLPVGWSSQQIALLGRDGRYWSIDPRRITGYRKLAETFQPYAPAEMRSRLRAEFGPAFDVTTTTHYLVVHPVGDSQGWAERFERFYRQFVSYFRIRGWQAQEPQFPLVAVIFPDQTSYLNYTRRSGLQLPPEVIGYYALDTNRVLMFDMTDLRADGPSANLQTVFHEAAHQIAFNTGIHNRLSPPPRWVVEGLGMLFESPALWDPAVPSTLSSRVNRYRLERMRRYLVRRPAGALAEFLNSDRLFKTDPDAAYAEAWALSFFLAETRPRQYVDFLRRVAGDRPSGTPDAACLTEFLESFGPNLPLLEAHYLRFLNSLQ